MRRALVIGLGFLVFPAASAQADRITVNNADFESGTLAGWTPFTNEYGTTGPLSVLTFGVTGTGETRAVRFLAGQKPMGFATGQQGGGLFQNFMATAGALSVQVDIAASNTTLYPNAAAGGHFSMLLDGVVVDSFDFGAIAGGTIERSKLAYRGPITAGPHELRFLITTSYTPDSLLLTTPYQYLDNVTANVTPNAVPEPTATILLLSGLAALVGRSRIRRLLAPTATFWTRESLQ